MNHEIKSIPFEGSELLGVKTDDGKIWMGVKKACLDIGLSVKQADNEVRKIQAKGDIAEVKERMTSLENTVKQMIDHSTINSRQTQTLLAAAKNRVSVLLGGAHSLAYRANSRVYFKTLWLNLCDAFGVGSYKDLNPTYIDDALRYINRWEYL